MNPLLVIVGPTASGKSDLAVRLALELNGEVISADSVQVYRHFNVGTGKLSSEEQQGVPHHLLDVADPDEPFSAARFVELADRAVEEIAGRHRQVVVAGGTGLYVRALLRGLFSAPASDPEIREHHRRIRQEQGVETLFEQLRQVDPRAADRINPMDFMRISRALEVYEQVGVPITDLQDQHAFAAQRYPAVVLGLRPDRAGLRQRIELRVDGMIEQGWLKEVHWLMDSGYASCHPMGALGYRHLRDHLQGKLDLSEAIRQTKRDTWRFAKRQLNWFATEPSVRWHVEASEVLKEQVRELLRRHQE